ncbi:glycosyltransferase family 4 protein [Salinivibrio sp. IB643]|uniref:glycosyltransferase family 4 protein n=1 Tax=Salinivibrio sp. IB643 TaxID=1909445 RepID=UPI0009890271|nr:glycosyltransferase family 1 protein [Salinivibrio sp. IB643]OOE95381.1 glycosyl transferase [Salinivibrio sp. IB643]
MQTKVLINLSPIKRPLTGIGYYTLNIVKELLKRSVEVVSIHDGRYLNSEQTAKFIQDFELAGLVTTKSSSGIKRKLVDIIRGIPGSYQLKKLLLTIKLRPKLKMLAENNYVYFEPSFIPFDYAGKTVTTIHDLSFVTHPEFHPRGRVEYLQNSLSTTIAKSDRIFVDSNFILEELNQRYAKSIGKTSTLYLGIDEGFGSQHAEDSSSLLNRLNLHNKSYILSVCTLEPRKNLTRLIDAYKSLPATIREQSPLVLVGDSGWKNGSMVESARSLVVSGQIKFTGYVSDRELKQLYASAMVFAYPSLYEGFGLPVVEAMASGSPVLTSNCGATKEVAGDGALLVEPKSIAAITSGLLKLSENPLLREQLVEKGNVRVAQFTWKKTVDDLLLTIERL